MNKKVVAMMCVISTLLTMIFASCTNEATEYKVDRSMRNEYEIVNIDYEVNYTLEEKSGTTSTIIPYYGYYDEMRSISFKKYRKMLKKGEIHVAEENKDYLVSKYKNGICINKYIGNDKDVVIPNKLEGLPVIKLGGYMTYDPDIELTEYNCAFNISSAESIKLPKYLKYIIKDSLNYGCRDGDICNFYLKKITVNSDNKYYSSVDGILYSKDKRPLLQIPNNYSKKTINVREGTKAIYSQSVYTGSKILKVPASVVSFGEHIGKKFTKNFTNGIHSEFAINTYDVDCFESYEVSDDNKYYSSIDGVLYDKNQKNLLAYPLKKAENEYIVPDSVTYISKMDLTNADNLDTITMGRQVSKTYMFINNYRKSKLTVKCYKDSAAEKQIKKMKRKCQLGKLLVIENLD